MPSKQLDSGAWFLVIGNIGYHIHGGQVICPSHYVSAVTKQILIDIIARGAEYYVEKEK